MLFAKSIAFISLLLFAQNLFGQEIPKCIEQELGNIPFNRNSIKLTAKAKKQLDSLIQTIAANENCQVIVSGYSADLCEKCSVRSWDRSMVVLSYLARKGIPKTRLSMTSYLEGNLNIVKVFLSTNDVAPRPNIRGK